MARLPVPGSDNGTWGDVLNSFLGVAHNSDGTLLGSAVQSAGAVVSGQIGAANGVAGLNGSAVVPSAQLGSGTSSSSTFLRGDGTWAVPSGGTTLDSNATDIQPLGVRAAGSTGLAADAGHVHAMPRLDQVSAPTASVGLNAQKITNIANGTAASDAAAFGQIPTTAASIGGLTAPGSTANEQGYAPLVLTPSGTAQWGMPWQFNVLGYGAKGDGVCVLDGAMTNGSAVLTCSTSTPFTSNDVGKAIMVKGAITDATGTTLVTTIASFQSSSQVTLSASATHTVSSGTVLYGTDDTSAIQNAVNAAVTYAQGHSQYAEVVIPPTTGLFYVIAGALVTGGSTKGNAQITMPIIATTAAKVTLVLKGGENGGGARYWDQTYPAFNGPTLVSFGVFASASAQATSITNNGNPAIIGGPTGSNGYGTGPGTPKYSNMMLTLAGLTLLTPHSVNGFSYGAVNGYGIACLNLFDISYGSTGVVLFTNGGGDFSATSNLATGLSIGVLMPSNGNNDSNQVRNVICQGGYTYAFFASEHTDAQGLTILYCWSGLCLVGTYGDFSGSGVGALHAIRASQVSIEACDYHVNVIGSGSASIGPIFNGVIDTEGVIQMRDTTSGTSLNAALGVMCVAGSPSTIGLTAATGMQIIKQQQLPGPAATPSFSLNAAQINAYWRPATVYVSGGTNITSIQISNLAGGPSVPNGSPASNLAPVTIYSQSAGALPQMSFRVGPGQWWVINANTGASAPTMQWILD